MIRLVLNKFFIYPQRAKASIRVTWCRSFILLINRPEDTFAKTFILI